MPFWIFEIFLYIGRGINIIVFFEKQQAVSDAPSTIDRWRAFLFLLNNLREIIHPAFFIIKNPVLQ